MAQQVKLPLGAPTSDITVWVLVPVALFLTGFLLVHPGRQQAMAPISRGWVPPAVGDPPGVPDFWF